MALAAAARANIGRRRRSRWRSPCCCSLAKAATGSDPLAPSAALGDRPCCSALGGARAGAAGAAGCSGPAIACAGLAGPLLILRAAAARAARPRRPGARWRPLLALGPALLVWRNRGRATDEAPADPALLAAGAAAALLPARRSGTSSPRRSGRGRLAGVALGAGAGRAAARRPRARRRSRAGRGGGRRAARAAGWCRSCRRDADRRWSASRSSPPTCPARSAAPLRAGASRACCSPALRFALPPLPLRRAPRAAGGRRPVRGRRRLCLVQAGLRARRQRRISSRAA